MGHIRQITRNKTCKYTVCMYKNIWNKKKEEKIHTMHCSKEAHKYVFLIKCLLHTMLHKIPLGTVLMAMELGDTSILHTLGCLVPQVKKASFQSQRLFIQKFSSKVHLPDVKTYGYKLNNSASCM